jgi:hypothetical protein
MAQVLRPGERGVRGLPRARCVTTVGERAPLDCSCHMGSLRCAHEQDCAEIALRSDALRSPCPLPCGQLMPGLGRWWCRQAGGRTSLVWHAFVAPIAGQSGQLFILMYNL